jgi:hypothetical protein
MSSRVTRSSARQAASQAAAAAASSNPTTAAADPSSAPTPTPATSTRKRKTNNTTPAQGATESPSSTRRPKRQRVAQPSPQPQPPPAPAPTPSSVSRRRQGKAPATMSSPGCVGPSSLPCQTWLEMLILGTEPQQVLLTPPKTLPRRRLAGDPAETKRSRRIPEMKPPFPPPARAAGRSGSPTMHKTRTSL